MEASRASMALSKFLRHTAPNPGSRSGMTPEGFVLLSRVLASGGVAKHGLTEADARALVAADGKQRFTLREGLACAACAAASLALASRCACAAPRALWLRANQGHSAFPGSALRPELIFTRLRVPEGSPPPRAIHGTRLHALALIKASGGLRPLKRTHVHFSQGLPGESGVISGMRRGSTVLLHLDVARALAEGLELFVSANGVVLCSGNAEGLVPLHLFSRIDVHHGQGSGCAVSESDEGEGGAGDGGGE